MLGVMEKKKATLGPFKGIYRVIYGLSKDNRKDNGNPRSLERDI